VSRLYYSSIVATQESSLNASSMFFGSIIEKSVIIPFSLFKEALVLTPDVISLMMRFGG